MRSGNGRRVAVAAGLPILAVGVAIATCIGVCVGYPCFTTGLRYGMWVDRCPATDLRLDVSVRAWNLIRGEDVGMLDVRPIASWLDGDDRFASRRSAAMVRGYRVAARLVDAAGDEVPGLELGRDAKVRLPAVPDGDYVLKVTVDAGFESTEVDLDLPLYAPAVVHLMTDRPLYKPGQEVLLRSVALDRTDLTPIEGRPGRWRVVDPEGTVMLVEKDAAGPWGIADSSFPLDARAAIGTWTATWETGGASDTVSFDVRPFQLPRFTVEANPARPWFGIGDDLVVEGRATYTSGAPIPDAPVRVRLSPRDGRWPMPVDWEPGQSAVTGPDGRFRVDFGEVPSDLMDRTTFSAVVEVTEPAGEVVRGVASLVLSRDDLKVEAVTELGDGLVGGFNNRVYLRVATPDGQSLPGATVNVSNPYDPMDTGRQAETDDDGVLAIQLDPGDPVTVIEPAPPARPRPLRVDPPQLVSANVAGSRPSLSLEERRAVDRDLSDAVAACGLYAVGDQERALALQVDRAGAVRRVMAEDDLVSACVADAARRLRLPAGDERTLSLRWRVPDSLRPHLLVVHRDMWRTSKPVQDILQDAALRARRCLDRGTGADRAHVLDLHWAVTEGARAPQISFVRGTGTGLSPQAVGCVEATLAAARLDDAHPTDAMGVATLTLSVPRGPGVAAPQPVAWTAYELAVATKLADGTDASTRFVLPVGDIPALRMRATPSLAAPGDTVTFELLRGPSFAGALPGELRLYDGSREIAEAKVADNAARFPIPPDVDGFVHVEWGGARAVVFVQRPDRLAVGLATDKPAYRPGEQATLTVTTTRGAGPVSAGVGLVGVDSALGQLAPLLGPDDYGRVTIRAASARPAFEAFDPRALSLGQVRGENAAKAAVLRISSLPTDRAGDASVSAAAERQADTVEVLTTSFYRALGRVVHKVRLWEQQAPEGAMMEPARMVTLWNQALDELRSEGTPAVDGYGRPLALDVLPEDLLAQVDPRQVVADGTRLPEDVVSWTRYVAEEMAR